jgi:hypothetical protein
VSDGSDDDALGPEDDVAPPRPAGTWGRPEPPPAPPPTGPPAAPGAPAGPGAWTGPPGPPGYGGAPVPGGYGYAAPQTEGLAIGAFVTSLVAWVVCPVIPAIVALVLASRASQRIRESQGWRTGEGFVTAARVIAWVNIAAFGALIVLMIILGAIDGGSSSSAPALGPLVG